MSDNTPHHRHAEDAHADGGAPTDAASDEVKADAARAGAEAELDGPDDNETFPQDPSITHP
ncbi:hypothetical protein [Microbacterium thalli]|uniref:Uncharacterized protein n=1 Tax=Microbacterium thalli TaxID=3027921 RepID=A0ABT5SI64_9MICO|nr:hypothetical protein [Microbacterium thalli]MDD7930048.1 hypothetical protein [Microbacterium thalli]MDD7962494.1 hypothetical protein [Microbacterium thalli]MDN8548738.1 hypothetical protein [Microbacterium thalli]